MSLIGKTKRLLKKYNVTPVHYRGQNFLLSEKILDKIVTSANLSKKDIILEVGPGLGFLTKKLAEEAKEVVAVELDKDLVNILNNELGAFKNIKIIEGNILKLDINSSKILPLDYKIVANLPYNITSRFIRTFLEAQNKPQEMTLMVQREVAERITAKPGQMSLLSLSCQFYADCSIEFLVGRENFFPPPKVMSAVIKIMVKDNKHGIDPKNLFTIAHLGFSSKRKKLAGNLSKGLKIKKEEMHEIFDKLDLDKNIRAQALSVDNWVKLTKELF